MHAEQQAVGPECHSKGKFGLESVLLVPGRLMPWDDAGVGPKAEHDAVPVFRRDPVEIGRAHV